MKFKMNNLFSVLTCATLSFAIMTTALAQERVAAMLSVQNAGVVKITHGQLLAQGVNLNQIPINTIGVYKGETGWPSQVIGATGNRSVFGVGGYVLFGNDKTDDRFNDQTRYTLKVNGRSDKRIVINNAPVKHIRKPYPKPCLGRRSDDCNLPGRPGINPGFELSASTTSVSDQITTRATGFNLQASNMVAPLPRLVNDLPTKDNYSQPIFAPALEDAHETVVTSQKNSGYHANSTSQTPFYSLRLSTNNAGNSSDTIALTINHLAQRTHTADLSVDMWGGYAYNTHHYQIAVNGVRIGSGKITGEDSHTAQLTFSSALLNEGANTLTITNVAGQGYSRFYVGQAQLTSNQRLVSDGKTFVYAQNQILQSANTPAISDFSIPNVITLKEDDGQWTRFMKSSSFRQNSGQYTVMLPADDKVGRLMISTTTGTVATTIRAPYLLANDARNIPSSDLVVIAADELISTNPMRELSTLIEGQGLSVATIAVESIYDRYDESGKISPDAISDFIADASHQGVRYILLVGGESHDGLDRLGYGSYSLIPTHYVETPSMRHTPSDTKYGDTDNDHVPDVIISRLPVFTVGELQDQVMKTRAFVNQSNDGALFVSDERDVFLGHSFLGDSQTVAQSFDMPVRQLSLDDVDITVMRKELITRLNNDGGFVNYTGHSSLNKLGLANTVLDNVDIAALNNHGNPFAMTLLGCNASDFTLPAGDSIAQSLLSGPTGAVSVIGQTARVNPFNSKRLAQLYYHALSSGSTQGEALLAAQQAFAAEQGTGPGQMDVLLGTQLLGVPTLVLP